MVPVPVPKFLSGMGPPSLRSGKNGLGPDQTELPQHYLALSPHSSWPSQPSLCMESISTIHFLIQSIFLYLFLFTFVSLCDLLSVYDLFSVMSSHPPFLYISTSIPVSVCATLAFLTCIYKPCMSCMSPQFIYQLQFDYYCHSLPMLNLSFLPLNISGLQKLFDS